MFKNLFKCTYANRFRLCVPQIFFPKIDQNLEINSKKLQQSSDSQIFFVYAFKKQVGKFCLNPFANRFPLYVPSPSNTLLTHSGWNLQPDLKVGPLITKNRYVLEKLSFSYKGLSLKIGLKSHVLRFFWPKTSEKNTLYLA